MTLGDSAKAAVLNIAAPLQTEERSDYRYLGTDWEVLQMGMRATLLRWSERERRYIEWVRYECLRYNDKRGIYIPGWLYRKMKRRRDDL